MTFKWFQPHWISYGESRILDSTQNPIDLTIFRILGFGGIAVFPFDFVAYEGMEQAFNEENQALCVPWC